MSSACPNRAGVEDHGSNMASSRKMGYDMDGYGIPQFLASNWGDDKQRDIYNIQDTVVSWGTKVLNRST